MNPLLSRLSRTLRLDAPQRRAGLAVVPILGESRTEPHYRLLEPETMPFVKVTEVTAAGQVNQLLVENSLDELLYLMDGQELVGAKQNRILNTDVLVPARTTIRIPVSCVEQGRWHRLSRCLSPGKSAHARMRSSNSSRVHKALRNRGVHDADQRAVWADVAVALEQSMCASDTGALNDAYGELEGELNAYCDAIAMPATAVGVAMFRGRTFLGFDLFDRHSTLSHFWRLLLASYAFDHVHRSFDADQLPTDAETSRLQMVLEHACCGEWETFRSPGEGSDYRLTDKSLTGSALVWADSFLIHTQLFTAT